MRYKSGFVTNPLSQFARKVPIAFKENSTEIARGDELSGFFPKPHGTSQTTITPADKENATEIFRGDRLSGFVAKSLSPFGAKIAIALKEKCDCDLRWR